MMKKTTLFAMLFVSLTTFAQVIINEIDVDQTSTDINEFIELQSNTPNLVLDGLILVLYNGTSDTSYKTVDLSGNSTDANGFFIIGSDAVPQVDIMLGETNTIQNGADAIAIYQAAAVDFPNGTAVTSSNLVDAIVYGTNDDDDAELLAGLNQTIQWDEDINGMKDTESLQRREDGTFCANLPTLRTVNICAPLSINSYNRDTFTMYPNPSTKGYISITSIQSGSKTIAIYDVLGKEVFKTVLFGERLDISKLTSGIYIVRISQANASTTKKLVIN